MLTNKYHILYEQFINDIETTGLKKTQDNLKNILISQNYKISLIGQDQLKINFFYRILNFIKFLITRKLLTKEKNHYFNKKKINVYEILNINFLDKLYSVFFNTNLEIKLNDQIFDLVHSPFINSLKYTNTKKKIITIHDAIPFDYPDLYNKNKFLLFFTKKYHQRCIDNCDAVITVSKYSKNRILCHFKIKSEKIHVLYHPYISPNYKNFNLKLFDSNFIKSNHYYIFFGAFEPKKNILFLIKSFIQANSKHKLLLIKSKGWKNKEIFKFINSLSDFHRQKIIIIDHQTFENLITYIKYSRALIFPSLVEGFGLPIIEASDLGTPVILSDIPVFRELFDDYKFFINPMNSNDLIATIKYLDIESNLSFEKKNIIKSKKFNLSKFKRELNNIYTTVLNEK